MNEITECQIPEITIIAGMFDPDLLPGSLSRELVRLSDEVNLLGYNLMSSTELAKRLQLKAVERAETMSKAVSVCLTEREIRSRLKIWNTRLELLQDRCDFFKKYSDGLECCYGEFDDDAGSLLYRDPRVWNRKDHSPEAIENVKEISILNEEIRASHSELKARSNDPLELIFKRIQRCTYQLFLIWQSCADLLVQMGGPKIPEPSAIDWSYYWPTEAAKYRTLTEEERDQLYFGTKDTDEITDVYLN